MSKYHFVWSGVINMSTLLVTRFKGFRFLQRHLPSFYFPLSITPNRTC